MPRYNLSQQNVSPRERKASMMADQQQNDAQAGLQDTQQTNAMLQQLSTLYGLQQEQQMGPEKLHALQLENTGREYNNAQAPVEDAARTRLQNAQASHFESYDPNKLTPEHIMHWEERTGGKPLPPELMHAAPDWYQQHFAEQNAKMESDRQAQISADQAQQGQAQIAQSNHVDMHKVADFLGDLHGRLSASIPGYLGGQVGGQMNPPKVAKPQKPAINLGY